MKQGQTIDYRVEAQSPVHFLIWNQPFEQLSRSLDFVGNYSETSMRVQANHDYQYIGYFLQEGSQITYEFNVTSGSIQFFIADANNLNRWNNWETIQEIHPYSGSDSYNNVFNVPYPQDWYLVWYNPSSSDATVDFSLDYVAVDNIDIRDASLYIESVVDPVSGDFTVPDDGTWYFFIYMDPFVNYEESVDITFEVMFNTEVTYKDHWGNATPCLLFIAFIIVVILVIAVIQRRSSKKEASTAAAASQTTTTTPGKPSPAKEMKCHRCNSSYKTGDVYCTTCGAKLQGRDYGESKVSTPADSKWCRSCGNTLKSDSNFCQNCGAKVEKKAKKIEFSPDERKSFFCQLDNEKHPSTDSAYQCVQCSRMVCADCYGDIGKTGVTACPYCKGKLAKVQ
jgi:hypothetical protein